MDYYCLECGRIRPRVERPVEPVLCGSCGCKCAPIPEPVRVSNELLRASSVPASEMFKGWPK